MLCYLISVPIIRSTKRSLSDFKRKNFRVFWTVRILRLYLHIRILILPTNRVGLRWPHTFQKPIGLFIWRSPRLVQYNFFSINDNFPAIFTPFLCCCLDYKGWRKQALMMEMKYHHSCSVRILSNVQNATTFLPLQRRLRYVLKRTHEDIQTQWYEDEIWDRTCADVRTKTTFVCLSRIMRPRTLCLIHSLLNKRSYAALYPY